MAISAPVSTPGLKQVKVDNWGTFFLQRLQQLYVEEELLDLKIKFPTSDIIVQAHRLVITTCTDFFIQLERTQREKNNGNFDGVLIMPSDMPYECVKSIISFMYTGQLEYWTSEQNALYRTAQQMNMTVLTKLLDAQFTSNNLQNNLPTTVSSVSSSSPSTTVTNNSPNVGSTSLFNSPLDSNKSPVVQKTVTTVKKSSSLSATFPATPLPGRKLPIWRRRIDTPNTPEVGSYYKKTPESTPGPSRFDLPDVDDAALGVFSSFDDITYDSKPIVSASAHSKSKNVSNDSKKSYSEEDEEDEDSQGSGRNWEHSDDDWIDFKGRENSSKRVKFDQEEKENHQKSKNSPESPQDQSESINNHAKIIREVLKKYPHLVKNNKNIRLKIMQKEPKSSDHSSKTKVSYVVLKSDHLLPGAEETKTAGDTNMQGPWKCHKCDLNEEYSSYYMYRRHMQDVHEEKFDPRICEHCGYKATKRNILMYHLYTEHNVSPPKSMSFPKCHACPYIALSETLLIRHQINHNHRPSSKSANFPASLQCIECGKRFKGVNELASHEVNSGHGASSVNGKNKIYRCPYCHKNFVKSTNLAIHIDCVHKHLRETTEMIEDEQEETTAIQLEPSSEAEALSNVASGIAASLGVGDDSDNQDIDANQTNFLVTEMDINNLTQSATYNGNGMDGQPMIMLIDGNHYQQDGQNNHPQQLEISSHELSGNELVMQDTGDGMIVYIHGNDPSNHELYETYQEVTQEQGTEEVTEETEEILEEEEEEQEVEEVEEVVEEVEEVEEVLEESNHNKEGGEEDQSNAQMEEEIQYVEETEILEYDEEQSADQHTDENQSKDQKESKDQNETTQIITEEWEEESIEMDQS